MVMENRKPEEENVIKIQEIRTKLHSNWKYKKSF